MRTSDAYATGRSSATRRASSRGVRSDRTAFLLGSSNAIRYDDRVIRSFRDRETERLSQRERSRALPPDLQRVALRKLVQLDAATTLVDLRVAPGNRLEPLRGVRAGQHGIRVGDRWRIGFRWREGGAEDVEIVDYH
jgi:toxin HigB-1